MQIYAIFLPSGLPSLVAAEKAVLVRQGFSWSAGLCTPAWALRHGLWLALALWFGLTLCVGVVATTSHLDPAAALGVYALVALAFGLEADRLREFKLMRSGFVLQGLSIGDTADDAESLYFQRRAFAAPQDDVKSPAGSRMDPPSAGGSDLLGLFSSQGK